MNRKTIPLGEFAANCTVLWNEPQSAWIIDPGADADDLIAFLEEKGLAPALIALTHGHFDHIGAIPGLLARWPGTPVRAGTGENMYFGDPRNAWPPAYPCIPRPATLSCDLGDGETLSAGGIDAEIVATPGHTPGGVCFLFRRDNLLVAGDTLFAGSCGRTDLPGGSMPQLQESLRKLAGLAPETAVICGHGASTTIGREVASNPFMRDFG